MDAGAIVVRPGSVIAVNDPVRQGDRRSGRIAAATTTQITVDDTANLESFGGSNKQGKRYLLCLMELLKKLVLLLEIK